ncbi:PREDICTED: transcription initiation factor TFIID subunit 7 isoform X1 [Cyphomyrmex costatus]|uniref:transcription initiation factor TFIID subunit 7 isoform X1 n=1 Tax=Cyphomyrmex costatus TaxID=456900 RepID=UPI00085229B9|nr:PREDICTED: transcription initiation factor TFIID subunit 7 isoform X1 [Cyphomyrmex costatus]
MNRHPNTDKNRNEPQVELESQFVMRLPPEPARVLREALRNSLPLKDRLTIKLENDMRYGEVRLDHWLLHAKVVDLPTIVESLKTIDNKSFYKTADICQVVICKEEEDHTATDEESPVKQKKKDPNKVDKKFLWPHGITPSTKNVRRRRFRKTLKKKYVEAPEIEKEVKRLLRVDNDAVNVKWEVICEDEDTSKPSKVSSSGTVKTKREINGNMSQSLDVAEHDIFGEAVSDSEDDDEEANINVMELDENSRLSADSRVSDSNSMQAAYSERSSNNATTSSGLVTEFSKDMFHNDTNGDMETEKPQGETSPLKPPKLEQFHSEYIIPESPTLVSISKDSRLATLHAELAELRQRRQQQEIEIANIENVKLRQRFQEILDNLLTQEMQKVQEIQDLEME